MSKRRITSNLIIVAAGQIGTWPLTLAHLILVSRYLGPFRLGEFVLASSFTTLLGLILGLGMDTYIVRAIARAPERGNVIISAALLVRGTLALFVPIATLMYARFAHLNGETSTAAYILGAGMIMQQCSNVLVATFQGHEQMSYGTIGNIVSSFVRIALTGLVIVLNGGVIAFAVNNTVIFLVILILNARWARRYMRLTTHISRRDVRDVIVGSFAFSAGNLFQTFYTSIDSVILGSLAGSRQVAFYGSATRLLTVPMILPLILGQATLPMLSRLGINPGTDFKRMGRKTLSLLITCAVPLTIGLATFAGPAIRIIFGASFQPAVPVLILLSLCVPFTFLDMQFYQILAAHNQEARWTAIMGVSCVLNPLINLLLIPLAVQQWHNGAIGAALSLFFTEGLMAAYGAFALRDVVLHPLIGRAVVGAFVGGFVQGAILRVVGSPTVPILIFAEVVAAIVHLGIAVALGALPRQDVIYLMETALRRPRRATA